MKLLALLSIAGFASAQYPPPFGPAFSIDDYGSGCSPGGCVTSFNLTYQLPQMPGGPSLNGSEPPFVARCSVISSHSYYNWTDCQLLQGGGETLENPNNVTGSGTSWVRARPLLSGVYGDRLTTFRHGYWDWDDLNKAQRHWIVEGAGGINTQTTSRGAKFLVGVTRFSQ